MTGITALNLRLINGNGIIAIADLQVPAWGVTLMRCYWKRENGRDRVMLPGKCIAFHSDRDAYRFQLAALDAMRAAAKQMLEEPAQ